MLGLVALAFLSASPAGEPVSKPLDRQEVARRLAKYSDVASHIPEAMKLVMVKPTIAFFMGGGSIYTYQVDSRDGPDGLCSVKLLSFRFGPGGPPPPPMQKTVSKPRMKFVSDEVRYVAPDGMIKPDALLAGGKLYECFGSVDYERSFASPDEKTAAQAHALLPRLRALAGKGASAAKLDCDPSTGVSCDLAAILESRLDEVRPCGAAAGCIEFWFSEYGSVYAGGQKVRVSTNSSGEPQAIEILNIPSPPPV